MYDPILLAAGRNALDKVLGKAEVPVGSHQVQAVLTVSLAGVLEKAPPSEIQALPDVNWAVAFALLALRLKASRPEARRIAGEVLRATIACPDEELPRANGFPDRVRDLEEEIALAREGGRKPKTRSGPLKWLGDCEIS
jgi:hypothetical protein